MASRDACRFRAVTPNIHRMVGKASLDAMSNGEAPIRLPDFLLAAIEKRFDWPGDGQLLTNVAVSYPIQLVLSIYLYADLLAEYALTPTWPGVLVILAAAVGLLHLELARKVTRKPRDGERTYVRIFGIRHAVRIASSCAVLTSRIVVALLPLMPVVIGRLKFNDPALPRWPLRYAAWYILVMYASFLFVGLATLGKRIA